MHSSLFLLQKARNNAHFGVKFRWSTFHMEHLVNSETLLPRSIKAEMDWGRQRKGGGSIATARETEIQHFNDQQLPD